MSHRSAGIFSKTLRLEGPAFFFPRATVSISRQKFALSSLADRNGPNHSAASIFSAISSIFTTLFQFLPVPGVFNALFTAAHDIFDLPCPFGK